MVWAASVVAVTRPAVSLPPSGPAAALYLWAYGSSVLAHVVFFGRPGSALVGGLVMGAVALPFARAVWTSAGRGQSA